MKHIFSTLIILSLSIAVNASEEFPYIEPVSVENAPIVKVVEPEPVEEQVEAAQTNAVQERKDADSDGVFDENDECPDTKENIVVDEKGCELDSDNDGVVDSKDECLDTSPEFMVDNVGCPQTATLKINFEKNKATITPELLEDLETFSQFLKDNVGYQVIIYGHTDSIGEKEYNKELSQKRADAVKEALVVNGIDDMRLTAIGKGEVEPIADNMYEDGRTKNRRIEVELLQ